MFSAVKIALIVITATCYHRSYTPPSVTETPSEQKKALKTPSVTLAERLIPAASLLTKVCANPRSISYERELKSVRVGSVLDPERSRDC